MTKMKGKAALGLAAILGGSALISTPVYASQTSNDLSSLTSEHQSYAQRGEEFFNQHKYTEALSMFDKAIAANQNDAGLLIDKANTLAVLKRDGEAEQTYGKAISLSGSNPKTLVRAHRNLAAYFKFKKEFKKAKEEYLFAFNLDPESANTNYGMATILDALGDIDGALPYAQRAFVRAKGDDLIASFYVRLLFKKKDMNR